MISIQTTHLNRHTLPQKNSVHEQSQSQLTIEQDQQATSDKLQIDLGIIKFLMAALVFDTIFFLLF